jgi:hypothetical protein
MEQLALAIPPTCCCSLRALGHATSSAGALPGRDGFALPGIGEVMGLTDQEPTTVDFSPTEVDCSPTKVDFSPTTVDCSPTKWIVHQQKRVDPLRIMAIEHHP